MIIHLNITIVQERSQNAQVTAHRVQRALLQFTFSLIYLCYSRLGIEIKYF